jgi:putative NADPH-quinone reductase
MTNVLIVQGHPDTDDTHLCHAIAEEYKDAAQGNGHSIEIITIAKEEIPFLRSKNEWEGTELPQVAITGQAAIQRADHIVLIYPLWMGDVPAILKAWIEQVLRQGFAFTMDKHGWHASLNGKSARVIITMGMPGFAYKWYFLAHSLRSLDRNILKFCGIKPVRWSIFGNAEDPSGNAQRKFFETARKLGAQAK